MFRHRTFPDSEGAAPAIPTFHIQAQKYQACIVFATPYIAGVSLYSSLSNYGSGSVFFKPIPRMTIWAGYSATSAAGNSFLINPLSPSGPLTYLYQVPTAAFNINLTKALAFKSSWNYYDYHEYSLVGPTSPRNFRGNVYTLSLR